MKLHAAAHSLNFSTQLGWRGGEREGGGERERQTHRQRQTDDRHTGRDRDRQTDKETETERDTEREIISLRRCAKKVSTLRSSDDETSK